ncbi:MAG TPA: TerC family protein [Dongiaceae bacterium]|nr:TerC family protein [Dongiaceae bacterium]
MTQQFLIALLTIIWINVLLSGDNAVAIALACRPLPPKQRRWGISLGSLGAIILRIIFATCVVYLLKIPYLRLIGGGALFWIAVKLILPEAEVEQDNGEGSTSLFAAIRTVVIADAVMSLDNVIAIAAAAHDDLLLLAIGLVISMPLIIFGSALVLKIIERFPLLVLAGGGLLGWIAGEVVVSDPVLVGWAEHEAYYLHDWYIARIGGAVFVVIVGLFLARKMKARRRQEIPS